MRIGIFGFALAVLANAAPTQTTSQSAACDRPEHRQFDFWVGSWDVYPTGQEKLVAHSLIEKLYAGCTIRENWMPLGKGGGGSLNMYDPAKRKWHQTWQDSQNGRVEFDGGVVAGKMVLISAGSQSFTRMTYSQNADGSVRQLGEQSVDAGKTWQPSFDFTYRKSASVAAN